MSRRIQLTDTPCIVSMQQMMRGREGVISLAQGIVHWQPPKEALASAAAAVSEVQSSQYGADDGLPELRAALKDKIAAENGLVKSEIMVTAGANQAYTNVVLSLLDAGDHAALFAPYYFNHMMALQMTGSHDSIHIAPSTAALQPDLGALAAEMEARTADGRPQIKMVTMSNPGNPTGVMIPKETLVAASDLCAKHGAWLILDNCYEHFAYPGEAAHTCLEGDHIVNLFSFSKGFGMMGWRVGYAAYPKRLGPLLLKTQDTIVICPSTLSQRLALAALAPGRRWVSERVGGLAEQKKLVLEALHVTLPAGAVQGGSGAIYLFCRLPDGVTDDLAVVRFLTAKHGVAVIPGSACGRPGYFRVCYANKPLEETREAARRLRAGLSELASGSVDLSDAALDAL
jgi:aspartate/methionine/tyrosine aminotransferase